MSAIRPTLKATARPEVYQAAVDAGSARRFAISDLPEWGEWLIGRISERYPDFGPRVWLGKIHQLIASNDFLFVRNERAVVCIGGSPRVIDGGLVLIEVFAFSRDAWAIDKKRPHILGIPDRDPAEQPLLLLYRHAREWARSQKAARFFVGQCSDIHPLRLKETLSPAAECSWIAVRL